MTQGDRERERAKGSQRETRTGKESEKATERQRVDESKGPKRDKESQRE